MVHQKAASHRQTMQQVSSLVLISYCAPRSAHNQQSAGDNDDDASEMTGFTNYHDGDESMDCGKSHEEAEATGDLDDLAQLGRKIGGEKEDAAAAQLAKDFAEFLRSRGGGDAAAEMVKPESLFNRMDRIRRETEAVKLAKAAQRSEVAPGADVGKGSAGYTTVGASNRRGGDPKGEAGKGADDQRSDDPG
jgi:hypothetical protein